MVILQCVRADPDFTTAQIGDIVSRHKRVRKLGKGFMP